MNSSIQDAWNLGWKLATCIKGRGYPALIASYETERRPVAQRLLSFDKFNENAGSGYGSRHASKGKSRIYDYRYISTAASAKHLMDRSFYHIGC